MNNQQLLTSENIQFLQETLDSYGLVLKIVPLSLVIFIIFVNLLSKNRFRSWLLLIVVIVSFTFYGIIYFIITDAQKKIEKDITNGYKQIIDGIITKKFSKKSSKYLQINQEDYNVDNKDYQQFETKDSVRLEILPISKTLVDITILSKNK